MAAAGVSKEHQLSVNIYNTLQRFSCPLVDGLYLREADSIQELLCTPSLHRLDILKWICISICHPLKKRFSTNKSGQQEEDVMHEITRFGHEMMLCKADDLELIKGLASPWKQLLFLEQLLSLMTDPPAEKGAGDSSSSSSSSVGELSTGDVVGKSGELLRELMAQEHLTDLHQLLNPSCNPWSASLQEHLRRGLAAQPKAAANLKSQHGNLQKESKQRGSFNKGSVGGKLGEEELAEATALLESTQKALGDLQKECEFLQAEGPGPGAGVAPCALRLATSDLAQLMGVFSQVYDTDFKSYCQRAPPTFHSGTHIFQSVHQLLQTCDLELQVTQQLSDTSSSLTEAVKQMQTDKQYWANGEKHTLANHLEQLMNRYRMFLSLNHS